MADALRVSVLILSSMVMAIVNIRFVFILNRIMVTVISPSVVEIRMTAMVMIVFDRDCDF